MNHPYSEFEKTQLWKTVDVAILGLQHNRDIELTTTKEHVVGYICQQLAQAGVVNKMALVPAAK